MENKRSFIDEILFQWGIQGVDFDTYLESYNDKNLIVDIYPFTVLSPQKFRQVAVFYGKFLDKTISKKCYFDCERKYLSFIRHLWLYNETDAFFDLYFDNYFRKGLRKQHGLKNCQASEELHDISDWCKVEELATLALREAGYVFLHFKTWNVITMINDFSIVVLCKEEKTTSLINQLSEKNSLFTRLCNT